VLQITVDGRIESCFTDVTSAKGAAVGFHVIEVYDGSNDVNSSFFPFDAG
jgi:dihydroxyacetone synthase